MTEDDKQILDEDVLSAWPAAEAPPGFADRVMAARAAKAPRRRTAWWAAAALAVTAAAILLWPRGSVEKGTLASSSRVETKLGERAVAVAEPGASLRWTVESG